MIHISPSEFWGMSPIEIYTAISGFQEFNTSGEDSSGMDRDSLNELMELYPD